MGTTERSGGYGGEAARASWSRYVLSDLSLLVIAVLILLVPPWLASTPRTALRYEERALRPFAIEVNSAPWYEWTLLDGIGEVRARQIVAYRRSHGPFRSIEDLRTVPGLPSGWLERARPHLSLDE